MSDLEKLESFLIKNSDISKEFINDFFGFHPYFVPTNELHLDLLTNLTN